jgi:hypothetical protein
MNVILAIYFSISHILTTHHILDWQELFSFQGPNPFQSRILPFAVGHLIFQLFSFKTIYVKLLFIIYDFTSSLLAIFYLHKIIKIYYPNYSALLITCILYWWQMFCTFIVSFHNNHYFPYDSISVFIIALSLYLILNNKNIYLLFILTIIGTLNRETAILIPAFYLAYNWDKKSTLIIGSAIMLFITCFLTKFSIAFFITTPKDLIDPWASPNNLRLFNNFAFIADPHTLNFFAVFGFLWILFILDGKIPRQFSYLLYPFIPFFIGMMFVANLSEIRVFNEFIPVITLALVGKFNSMLKIHPLIMN